MSGKRICIVIGTHLSACPRMVKAADALARAGHEVRVVSMLTFDWGAEADNDIVTRRGSLWRWDPVEFRRGRSSRRYVESALRQKSAMRLTAAAGAINVPSFIASRANERGYSELKRAAASTRSDLIYGGARAIASVFSAARERGTPFAIDLEDFHSGEVDPENPAVKRGAVIHSLFTRIERSSLPHAAFLTAGSDAIAKAYEAAYGVRPVTINNVFEPSPLPPEPSGDGPLRLYWFSQMVTGRRGIEDAVRAAGYIGANTILTLRGRPDNSFVGSLRALAKEAAPLLHIDIENPVFPDDLVDASRSHHVGLALEQGYSKNNELALSNKAFTYIAAGLAVAFTDTEGQLGLAAQLGDASVTYPRGNAARLGELLSRWDKDRKALDAARQHAWQAARTRWHWGHQSESGRLLELVSRIS